MNVYPIFQLVLMLVVVWHAPQVLVKLLVTLTRVFAGWSDYDPHPHRKVTTLELSVVAGSGGNCVVD